jgi:shikimate 5-dehydrogenase
MRILLLAGAAGLALAVPAALAAQQTADEANAQAQPAPSTTTVVTYAGGARGDHRDHHARAAGADRRWLPTIRATWRRRRFRR